MAELSLIDDIRAASRLMVRELGFMDATVAASDYPPSAVHTILEIGIRGPLTSGELGDFLRLEKSSVSRLVRKLIDCGELRETPDEADARSKLLSLTAKGRRTLEALHAFGRQQVRGALAALTEAEQRTVREGMMLYARALRESRLEDEGSWRRSALSVSSPGESRAIQYSETVVSSNFDRPRRNCGCPAFAGHDSVKCGNTVAYFPNSSRIFAWILAMPPIQRS